MPKKVTKKPLKLKEGFGGCDYDKFSPAREKLTGKTKTINIKLTLEEALKLGLAVDECVRSINKYDLRYVGAKKKRVNLALHMEVDRITVLEMS